MSISILTLKAALLIYNYSDVDCGLINNKPVEILAAVPPFSLMQPSKPMSSDNLMKYKAIAMIQKKEWDSLSGLIDFLDGLDKEAVLHTLSLREADDATLNWSARLTIQQLQGNIHYQDQKVQDLYQRVLHGSDYSIEKRDPQDCGHSSSYFLVDRLTNVPFAILKEGNPAYFSSFTRLLPKMPVAATVWEHEYLGYEQDQLFGLNHTPASLSVHFVNEAGEKVFGTIQKFIPDATAGSSYYNPLGAVILKQIPKNEVHRVALSGMFKGLSAAHRDNYILNQQKIYEIDLEEMLLPINILNGTEELSQEEADPVKKAKMYKSITLCRLWVLGLPQSDLPFDRDTLIAMVHPSFLLLLDAYIQEASIYSELTEDSWDRQRERLKMMQYMCHRELQKEQISLTPRDIYFAIFGGEHLWRLAQEKKFPALIAFQNYVSDPYQANLKDLSDPEGVPCSTFLTMPLKDKPEYWDLLNFLRLMEVKSN